MALVTLHPGVIVAIQAEQAARHGGRTDLKSANLILTLEARAEALKASAATDLASLAACYGYSLAHDQPFFDASTATALIATELLLALNGHHLSADDTTCCLGFMVAANEELSSDAFVAWIRRHISP
jgi:death on curing protein